MCFWAAWGHNPWSRKASSTWRCYQTTKTLRCAESFPWVLLFPDIPILLALSFPLLGWRSRKSLWRFPSPLQLNACLHHSCSGCSDTSSAGLRSAHHIHCAHFGLPRGLDPSCTTSSAILCAGRKALASKGPASSAPQTTCWKMG